MSNDLDQIVVCIEDCEGCEHNRPHKYSSCQSSCDGGGDYNCPACVLALKKLTKFQQYALKAIPDKEWHTPFELFGYNTAIQRRVFVAETLYSKGYLDQKQNPDANGCYFSDYFYLYRLKAGVAK